jgi:hypothetical protein
MQKLNINGYEAEIYSGFYGDDLFVSKNGEVVYSARVHHGDGVNRAMSLIK